MDNTSFLYGDKISGPDLLYFDIAKEEMNGAI